MSDERLTAIREAILCPVHWQRDCSPLLNGCGKVNEAHRHLDSLARSLAEREQQVTQLRERIRKPNGVLDSEWYYSLPSDIELILATSPAGPAEPSE